MKNPPGNCRRNLHRIIQFQDICAVRKNISVCISTYRHRRALELSNRPNVELLQLGGIVHHSSASTAGSFAERILDELFCGVLFLGVDGIDLEHGLIITNIVEASLNQKMIVLAQTVVGLADSSKFNKRGLDKICQLDQIDYIVTDKYVSKITVIKIEKPGIKVLIVA